MIRINLLPTKERAQAASQRQEASLFALSLVGVLLVCGFVSVTQARRSASLTREIDTLQASLKALESRVKDVADLDRKRKDLDAKLKVIAELGKKRVGPAEVLRDLARSTPDRLWLTDFNEARGAATLTGQAVDNQTIAQFLRDLSGSAYFTTVDLVETTQSDAGEVRLRKFIVKASVNYAATGAAAAAKKEEAPPPPADAGKEQQG